MAKYGRFTYGTDTYGLKPKLAYSVNPMTLTVLDFHKTYVTWQPPTGEFTRIRLVRNQAGYPEHAEDGVILWEETATEGNVSRDDFIDSEDAVGVPALESGRQVFYRVFLLIDAGYWVSAGQISDLIPTNHNMQERMMNTLPRVFTSSIQSPLGIVDETSALFSFMDGLSFTYEQLLTQTDLARPNHAVDRTPASLVPLESFNVGLDYEPNIPLRSQKRLVREALYMYSRKGLKSGIDTYVEALTGYAPTTTVSTNLLLTAQDSTFYDSTGNWQTTNCTIDAVTTQVPPTSEKVIDETYTCEIIAASSSSQINLGADAPITKGVPVEEEAEYTFGFQGKSPTSAGNITMSVRWYDKDGAFLSASTATALAANNTWQSKWTTITSPTDTVYASLRFAFSAAGTYYVDQVDLHAGDVQSFDEARAINILLNPNKSNYIKNPSFEGTTNEWTITADAFTLDSNVPLDILASDESLQVDISSGATIETTTDTVPVAEKYFTLSFYAVASAPVDATVTLTPRDNAVDITEAEISGSISLSTSWQRYSVTTYVDSSQVLTELDFALNVEVDPLSGETANVDSFQLEASFTATDPFDGNLSSQFGVVWEGTANESASHMYYGKALKVPRLSQTLIDWVPPNSFWRIVTYSGVEYTNLSI
jgi:hypothetical protein